MSFDPDKNGWRHFKLGPVEFGIVCIVGGWVSIW